MGPGKSRSPRVICLIPARSGSTAIPRKNLVEIGGHPLIAYSIEVALQCQLIDRVFVTTDCEEIALISRSYGAEVPFLRPKEISGDDSLDIEFVNHFLEWAQDGLEALPELIIHLRPTSPNRNPKIVDEGIQHLLSNDHATALRSISRFETTGFKLGTLREGYLNFFGSEHFDADLEYYNLPRQALPPTYVPNGYVDIIVTKTLLETGQLHGPRISGFETPPIADIDDFSDLVEAEQEMIHHPNWDFRFERDETKIVSVTSLEDVATISDENSEELST